MKLVIIKKWQNKTGVLNLLFTGCIFPVQCLNISCPKFAFFLPWVCTFPVMGLHFSCSGSLHFSCFSTFLTTFQGYSPLVRVNSKSTSFMKWLYKDKIYQKLSEIRKQNHLSTSKMKWLLKHQQITRIKTDISFINNNERVPYDITEKTSI